MLDDRDFREMQARRERTFNRFAVPTSVGATIVIGFGLWAMIRVVQWLTVQHL